jgi:hypothetical protein
MPKGKRDSAQQRNNRAYQKAAADLTNNTTKYPSYVAASKQKSLQKKRDETRKKAVEGPVGTKSNKTFTRDFPSPKDTMDGWRSISTNKSGGYTVDNGGQLQVKKIQVTPGEWKTKGK